jgi:hypothetical protein
MDLTPAERDVVQAHFLRRWLAARCPPVGRRKGDRPLPAVVAHLSAGQVDRFCRWAAGRGGARWPALA